MKKKILSIGLVFFLVVVSLYAFNELSAVSVLRIYDYETKEIYVEVPAKEGDKLFFGWTHSWEKIPWHEYYHIESGGKLVLDMIAFPAFGAGIPENKGTRVWTHEGMIYMDGINQVFPEFTWINSKFTGDIELNGTLIAQGKSLPDHKRLNLSVQRRRFFDGRR